MTTTISITKRNIKKRHRDGRVTIYPRYVVNYRDPLDQERAQKFFPKRKDAEVFKQQLIVDINNGDYVGRQEEVKVWEVIDLWFTAREGRIKPNSMINHNTVRPYIVGPILSGSQQQRTQYANTGRVPAGCHLVPMLGDVKIAGLTTAQIRRWFHTLEREVGIYTAKRAKMLLKSALELGAEDYNYRPPVMPKIVEKRSKPKKTILTPNQVGQLLEYAGADKKRGLYYAFPFLTGTRPSEQLALLWDDVDFTKNVIRIQRSMDQRGNVYEGTKTNAGTRDIPMTPNLRTMMLEFRVICTRLDGELYRVFPGTGRAQRWPINRRIGGGGPLVYQNWRKRFWVRGLKEAGVPYVSPHSARHVFISNLQAQGVEVGLVAKIAGHANPMVTLGHYTQAVRGGQDAIAKLDDAYQAK